MRVVAAAIVLVAIVTTPAVAQSPSAGTRCAPAISVSPAAARAGATVTVSGSDFYDGCESRKFTPMRAIGIDFLQGNRRSRLTNVDASGAGQFSTEVKIPASASAGRAVVQGTNTAGVLATAALTVRAPTATPTVRPTAPATVAPTPAQTIEVVVPITPAPATAEPTPSTIVIPTAAPNASSSRLPLAFAVGLAAIGTALVAGLLVRRRGQRQTPALPSLPFIELDSDDDYTLPYLAPREDPEPIADEPDVPDEPETSARLVVPRSSAMDAVTREARALFPTHTEREDQPPETPADDG